MKIWRKASLGVAAFAGTLLTQALPAHAVQVSRAPLFQRAAVADESLCGQVAIIWDDANAGDIPYASAYTNRIKGSCFSPVTGYPGIGQLDLAVTLQQAYAFTAIECGSVHSQYGTNTNFQYAYNWAGCPTNGPHYWRALGSYGGVLYNQYFAPQDTYPQPTDWILK
jgi:hypothetical protein